MVSKIPMSSGVQVHALAPLHNFSKQSSVALKYYRELQFWQMITPRSWTEPAPSWQKSYMLWFLSFHKLVEF